MAQVRRRADPPTAAADAVAPARSGAARRGRSPFAVEQLAADQHAADLVGAGADLVELGIAQDAAGREFVDVAVAAEALDRLERHRDRALRGVQQAGCRI